MDGFLLWFMGYTYNPLKDRSEATHFVSFFCVLYISHLARTNLIWMTSKISLHNIFQDRRIFLFTILLRADLASWVCNPPERQLFGGKPQDKHS